MAKKKAAGSKGRIIPLKERIGKSIGIPGDLISGGLIELRGRTEITVEGCRKIEKYDTDEIILRLSDYSVSFRGRSLCCTAYYTGAIGILGYLDSVCFIGTDDYEKLSKEDGKEDENEKKD